MNLSKFKGIFKIIGSVIILLIILLVTVFAGRTASNYFAKAAVCPATNVETAQVAANSAVVSWETEDVTQGRVEYGTNSNNLTFSAPEATSGKIHSVPLTLLTPNTVYYYVTAIGNTKCDSTGEACKESCIPWSFTTSQIVPQEEIEAQLPTVTPDATPTTVQATTPTAATTPTSTVAQPTSGPSPTSGLSAFCLQVQANIGKTSLMTTEWPEVKQYDIDGNGVINGIDVFKCQQQGK